MCKKFGHTKAQCWYNEANIAKETKDEEGKEDSGALFMAVDDTADEDAGATWIIDSGCSNHMTGNKMLFQTLKNATQQTVKLGDGKMLQVAGVGTVTFRSNSGKSSQLHQVQFVPQLAHNLLSVEQLMASG